MYVMEYQSKLVLEFFCRNPPSRPFLLLSGVGVVPGRRLLPIITTGSPAPVDRQKGGRLVWSEDSIS